MNWLPLNTSSCHLLCDRAHQYCVCINSCCLNRRVFVSLTNYCALNSRLETGLRQMVFVSVNIKRNVMSYDKKSPNPHLIILQPIRTPNFPQMLQWILLAMSVSCPVKWMQLWVASVWVWQLVSVDWDDHGVNMLLCLQKRALHALACYTMKKCGWLFCLCCYTEGVGWVKYM